jgi:valyl-tRNA synthetase
LANKSYVENAPEAIVEQTRQQLADAKELLKSIEVEQKRFTS